MCVQQPWIIGLVDDLEIRIRLRLNWRRSQHILQVCQRLTRRSFSMLLERYSDDINGTLPIVVSKPLQLCTGGLRYLLMLVKKRVNAVLPDKWLRCAAFVSFCFRKKFLKSFPAQSNWERGVFNLKTRSISVTNLGPAYAGDKRIKGR